MRFRSVLIALCTLTFVFYLTACSSTEKVPLEGERISVLPTRAVLKPDSQLEGRSPVISKAKNRPDWFQSLGDANHNGGHAAVASSIKQVWKISTGPGENRERRLTNAPIVAGGRVFLMNTQLDVQCVVLANGKPCWTKPLPVSEEEGVFPGGLAYHEGVLYATTGSGDVFALNAGTGDVLWQKSVVSPIYAAPTYAENKLFVLTFDNRLFVLSADDGALIWTHSTIEEAIALFGGTSPAVDAGVVYVPYSSGELYALRTSDGRYLWHDALSMNVAGDPFASLVDVAAAPVVSGDVVFAANHNGMLAAFHVQTGRRIWGRDVTITQTPWLSAETLYAVSDDQVLAAFNARNGGVYWTADVREGLKKALGKDIEEEEGKAVYWLSPLLVGERLILTSSVGSILAFDPYTGKPLRGIELGEGVNQSPVVADGTVLFLTNEEDLLAYR